MYCPRQTTYIIERGDNLYQIARHYQTTVRDILTLNSNVDPYNLQIGSELIICPGENYQPKPETPDSPACPDASKLLTLTNEMRLRWSQHVYWTRLLIVSIAERLGDLDATTRRLMRNPGDIADIFARYYPPQAAVRIAQLLTEHLQIGAELITALRDGDTAKAQTLNAQWYANADQMADAFSGISPYYGRQAMREMLYRHLDLTKQEVAMRLSRNYTADTKAFDAVEEEAMVMADMFTSGIIRQFPQMFS